MRKKSRQVATEIASQHDNLSIPLIFSRTIIMFTYNSKHSFTHITYSFSALTCLNSM